VKTFSAKTAVIFVECSGSIFSEWNKLDKALNRGDINDFVWTKKLKLSQKIEKNLPTVQKIMILVKKTRKIAKSFI
jgi:hypothetical protein